MSINSYCVRPGGLYRCCLATLTSRMAACRDDPADGETISCGCCRRTIAYVLGAWEWRATIQ